jgi:hypothetical protein
VADIDGPGSRYDGLLVNLIELSAARLVVATCDARSSE